jgi:hypothetical protein
MELTKELLRLTVNHALAVAYLHPAAGILDGYLYRLGMDELAMRMRVVASKLSDGMVTVRFMVVFNRFFPKNLLC